MSFYSPLMLGYAIFSKDIKEKIIFGIFFILSIFALVFSRSEAGVLGTISAIILMLTFIYIRHLLQNREKEEYTKVLLTRLVPLFLAMVIIPFSISYVPMERNPLERIRKEAIELLTPNKENIDYREVGPINDIRQIDDQTIELVIENETTYIRVDDNDKVYVLNSDMEVLWEADAKEVTKRANNKFPNNEKHDDRILIEPMISEDFIAIRYFIRREKVGYIYFLAKNGNFTIADSIYRPLDIEKDFKVAPYFGFQGKGRLASNRGYIWSRSIPLIFQNTIIGSGQDTFVTKFPQYDIYGAQVETSINSIWTLVDKPHSLYIQIGVQSGFISLILALIGFVVLHIKGLKKYLNIKDTQSLVITSSIFGWLISSIFNDSIIGVTPIVMIIIGILCFLTIDIKIKDKVVKNNE